MLELLSPAGSPEAVVAAVQNGADAVYMGLGIFNARRGAKNFSEEEFEKAVRYCRIRDCKVYVTMNTLVGDREMEQAVELARARIGSRRGRHPCAGSRALERFEKSRAGYSAAREHPDEHP